MHNTYFRAEEKYEKGLQEPQHIFFYNHKSIEPLDYFYYFYYNSIVCIVF